MARSTIPTDGPAQVEAHLASLPEPQQSTLRALRATLRQVLPDADECLKYRMPAFVLNGKGIVAYDGFKRHCSYFPMSGNVLEKLGELPAPYVASKGTLQFPVDRPLPITLVRRLVKARLADIADRQR